MLLVDYKNIISIIVGMYNTQECSICQKCKGNFPWMNSHQLFQHIKACNGSPLVIHINLPITPNQPEQYQYEKVPKDSACIDYTWERKKVQPRDDKIFRKNQKEIRQMPFQQKVYWLQNQFEGRRIDWIKGADRITINKENLLFSSLDGIRKVNMLKEIKIIFEGDIVDDAGGLLKEWIHLCLVELFQKQMQIFERTATSEVSYKLRYDRYLDGECIGQFLRLFGTIIGKALFENIPLSCYLDRTILRQLCSGEVCIQDLYSYDQALYTGFKYLQTHEGADSLDQFFVLPKEVCGNIEEIELIHDGKNVLVNDQNKQEFIDHYITIGTIKEVQQSIKAIKQGIEMVFPLRFLSVFQPYELEMLLYGIPFVDIKEWKQNTKYNDPYSEDHKLIKQFWKVIEGYKPHEHAKVLQYCTGSTRLPISGFQNLKASRGYELKFTIVPSKYDSQNKLPKAQTCFNRLLLPLYPYPAFVKKFLDCVVAMNFDGLFGLE